MPTPGSDVHGELGQPLLLKLPATRNARFQLGRMNPEVGGGSCFGLPGVTACLAAEGTEPTAPFWLRSDCLLFRFFTGISASFALCLRRLKFARRPVRLALPG